MQYVILAVAVATRVVREIDQPPESRATLIWKGVKQYASRPSW